MSMLLSASSLPAAGGQLGAPLLRSLASTPGRCLLLPSRHRQSAVLAETAQQHAHQHPWPAPHPAPNALITPPPVVQPFRRASTFRAYAAAAQAAADGGEEPIIVAASWLGAKKRPFSKYKDLWRSLGFSHILAARPPMTSIMLPAAGQLLAADFTRQLIAAAARRPASPILVHLFSGGGFIFMGWVFQLLAELEGHNAAAADVRRRIAGVILDSSPANVTADVSSRAMVAAALGQPAEGIEQAFPWLVRPAAAVVDGYLRLPFIRDALVSMERVWLQQAPPCPKLFLYSDADVLIEPGVVEGFMAQQAAAGSATSSFKWRDSGHVEHYRKHPEQYRQQLHQFVEQVLGPGSVRGSSCESDSEGGGSVSSSGGSSSSSSGGNSAGSAATRSAGDELV